MPLQAQGFKVSGFCKLQVSRFLANTVGALVKGWPKVSQVVQKFFYYPRALRPILLCFN